MAEAADAEVTSTTRLARQVMGQFAPPPEQTVSQWADAEVRLPHESSAEPGQWRTDRAPYQRAIMDAAHDPSIHTVVLMASAQIGKTACMMNIMGATACLDPGPMLWITPTLDASAGVSKERIMPLIRDTPALQRMFGTFLTRRAKQTTLHMQFPGGYLALAGANSPASLASRPIRILFADEIDKYDVTVGRRGHEEGDPLLLAIKRTTTFWNRKIYICSTPTVQGVSRIEFWYGRGDQRRFFVPCPRCGAPHQLEWKNVRWESRDPATAHLRCPVCDGRIEERERPAMIRAGQWRATAPFTGIASFFIWEAYSPWVKLAETVGKFLAAREEGAEAMRTWVNSSLGQSWEDQAEKVEPHVLLARREPYGPTLPARVCCLTLSIDVQDDRLECLVVGWGPGEEAWYVESRVIPGDPMRPEPWAAVDELLAQPWPHASGAQLMILATTVDSGGHRTNDVYEFVRRRTHLRVYAIIGHDGDRPAVSAPSQKRSGRNPRPVQLFTLGVDGLKALLYSRLRIAEPGPGYIHLPSDRTGFDEEFIAQLTAEKLVTLYKAGIPSRHWVQTRPRNEALDLAVYALGALRLLNPKLELMAERVRVAAQAPPPPVLDTRGDPAEPPPPLPPPAPPPGRRVFRSSYMDKRQLPRRDWR